MKAGSDEPRALRDVTVSSLGWAWAGVALQAVLQIAYTAAISRIVAPSEFGVLAAGMLILRFVTYLGRAGVFAAVMQRRELSTEDLAAANSLALGAGAAGTVVGVLIAPLASFMFDVAGVVTATQWVALGLLLGAPGIVPDAQLRRDMRFRTITVLQTISYLCSNIFLAIPLALFGYPRAALLTAYLAGVALYSLLARAAVRPRPGLTLKWPLMRRFARFGGTVAATSLLDVISSSSDTIYAGRLGAGALGQYNRASLLISLPLEQVSAAAAGAARAALVKMQDDLQRFAAGLLTAIGLQAALAAVVVGFGAASAPALVPFVLGGQWANAISILPFVASAHALASITQQVVGAAESLGKIRERLRLQAACTVSSVTLVSAFYLSTRSLVGVAIGWLLGESVRLAGHLRLASRHLGAEPAAIVRRMAEALVLGGVAAVPPTALIRGLGLGGLNGLLLSGCASLALLSAIGSTRATPLVLGDLNRLQLLDRAVRVLRGSRSDS